jgi:branched-chain amino acid transport system substrate-binding protein
MYALTPLVTSYHIPYVGCFSGADDVTKRKRSEWVMRTSYSNSQPMHPFGVYAAKQLHYKRIATIGMDYQYCWELVGGFQQTYENAGGQIVQKLWAANGTEDFADVVSKLRTDVDAVLIATSGKSAEYLPKYVRAANPKIPILGAMTSFDEDVIAKVGTPFDGAVGCSTYCAEIDSPDNKRFVKAFRQAYGKSPGWYSENGYTNGLWIATAIEAMHGNLSDKEKFRIALRSVKLHNAPRGPIEMDAFGNPIDNVYIRRLENVNGQIQSSIIFTYSKVSQFWTWKPEEFMAQPPYSRDYPPCTHCEH